MNSGTALWNKAKQIIPGGNSLLSKRSEMFLPNYWPSYFSKSKGVKVWDMDGKEYIDMCLMGVGTNILGYSNDEVDSAVIDTIKKGNTSTLNCPEEVFLAERIIQIHPWAQMVRYSRTGGEACAMAIRIGRAASGKDGVAFCGYHGWHDWYLAANLSDNKNLDGMLLPGLQPNGVPRGLKGSSIPFEYNDFKALEDIVNNNSIGVIMMETIRSKEPQDNFLQKVRALADKKNIVLVFDEVSAGFRTNLGGIHLSFGVNPDIAVIGKALGNGYAISAIFGKRDIMQAAQTTFISSSYWTERTGPVAALTAINIMERDKVFEKMVAIGQYIVKGWQSIANKYSLLIETHGLASVPHLSFVNCNNLVAKTFITQEMLKKGYLASTGVYVSCMHNKEIVEKYMDALDPVFGQIKCGIDDESLEKKLDGPICHSGFARLA